MLTSNDLLLPSLSNPPSSSSSPHPTRQQSLQPPPRFDRYCVCVEGEEAQPLPRRRGNLRLCREHPQRAFVFSLSSTPPPPTSTVFLVCCGGAGLLTYYMQQRFFLPAISLLLPASAFLCALLCSPNTLLECPILALTNTSSSPLFPSPCPLSLFSPFPPPHYRSSFSIPSLRSRISYSIPSWAFAQPNQGQAPPAEETTTMSLPSSIGILSTPQPTLLPPPPRRLRLSTRPPPRTPPPPAPPRAGYYGVRCAPFCRCDGCHPWD